MLDTDVSSIDTSFPRITAGLYEMSVDKAESVPNKAQTGNNIRLTLKTVSPASDTNGNPVPAGFTLTNYIACTPTEKYTSAMIAKSVATFMKAAGLSGSPRSFIDNPIVAEGKILTVKVGIRKETPEFPESNEVKGFVIKA